MKRRVLSVLVVSALGIVAVTGVTRAGAGGAGREAASAVGPSGVPRVTAWGDATTPRGVADGTPPRTATTAEPQGASDGARLFVAYNCGDCHGAAGSGAMAPSLQDNRWHFGGSQGEVLRSIAEGRPAGMPAWGAILTGPEMIALATYVRSLGEGKDLTTENFTGATVERSGR